MDFVMRRTWINLPPRAVFRPNIAQTLPLPVRSLLPASWCAHTGRRRAITAHIPMTAAFPGRLLGDFLRALPAAATSPCQQTAPHWYGSPITHQLFMRLITGLPGLLPLGSLPVSNPLQTRLIRA